jgi:TRAP-type C4-dicarboxylate transport system permease small subunit
MGKFFAAIDRGLALFVNIFLGCTMIALTLIVNVQVIARYVLNVSIGGVEELPVLLMIVSVWLAAAFVARTDNHVKIEFLDMIIHNARILALIKIILKTITLFVLAVFGIVAYRYVGVTFEMGDATPGLRIPMGVLEGIIPLSTTLMVIFYGKQLVQDTMAVIKWNY